MTPDELDDCYSHLCRAMAEGGEANAALLLARFAILAMARIGDARAIRTMIDEAAADLAPPPAA